MEIFTRYDDDYVRIRTALIWKVSLADASAVPLNANNDVESSRGS
jgi:hypothetical protein